MAATVDQGRNIINAWESMNVPVLICSGHRLNSAVTWGLGISGSFSQAGGGTCKNTVLRKLMAKIAAMVGHFSHSAVNNDAFKAVQREVQELAAVLELIRRNDTRYGAARGSNRIYGRYHTDRFLFFVFCPFSFFFPFSFGLISYFIFSSLGCGVRHRKQCKNVPGILNVHIYSSIKF